MNRTLTTIALISVLSMGAVSCQKEMIVEPQGAISEVGTVYTVRYAINGITHTETLIGKKARTEFLMRMLALAEEGYRVEVIENGETYQYDSTKEVLTFTTHNKKEAYDWMDEKLQEGYAVTITFDQETGEYKCIAIR